MARRLATATLLLACACGTSHDPATLEIAAAASLRPVLTELDAAFRAAHPGTATRVAYGASGSLLTQIGQGAPFALFLSADADAPAVLHHQGRGRPPFAYAVGHLAVWLPHDSPLDLQRDGLAALAAPAVAHIAIANPDHAPYGKAAIEVLQRANLLGSLRPKLVFGENVAQAAHFAQTGAADAAFVALAQARSPEMTRNGRSWPIPADLHPGLRHCGVVLQDAPAALAFAAFLGTGTAQAILRRHGYGEVGS